MTKAFDAVGQSTDGGGNTGWVFNSLARSLADNATAADALAALRVFARSLADGAAGADSLARLAALLRALADAAAAADVLAENTRDSRSLADTAGAADALAVLRAFARDLADAAASADFLAQAAQQLRALADDASAADVLSAVYPPHSVAPRGFTDESFGAAVVLTHADVSIRPAGFTDESFGAVSIKAPALPPYLPVPPVLPFVPASTVGLLGCGEYEVHFGTRGGTKLLGVVTATELQWQRVVNGLSAATVKFNQSGSGRVNSVCLDLLSDLNPWEHEVLLVRNGEPVFVGPITAELTYDLATGSVSVPVRDLSAWLDVRRINADYDQDESTPLSSAFSFIFNNAYAQDPWNMQLVLQDTSLLGAYSVQAAQNKYASSELQVLTKSSLDYYVSERTILAYDLEVQQATLLNLTDDHWKTFPKVSVSGKAFASSLLLTGSGAGAGALTSELSQAAVVKQFGLVDRTFTEPTITDQGVLDAAAQSRYALVSQPFATITGGALDYRAPIDVNALVPGIQVSATFQRVQRPISGIFRLVQVDAQRTATDETISLTLTPLGAVGPALAGTLTAQNQEAIGGGTFAP